MKNLLKSSIPYHIIFISLVAMGIQSCGSSTTDETNDQDKGGPDNLEITKEQLEASSMAFTTIEQRVFNDIIETNGIFDLPPQNVSSVSTYFGGFVSEVKVLPGEKVSKGQLLFSLQNPDYVEIQEQYLDAKSQLAYLKSDYDRKKELIKDNITSMKDYLKAEADYQSVLVKSQALKKKISMMNINPESLTAENIRTSIQVFAPINGQVSEVNVSRGMFINPTDVALKISDMDHLHLELIIFEKDLYKIKEGQSIKFSTQNNPGVQYGASVYLVNRTIDLEKRAASLHGHINTEDMHLFSPGMYVEASIFTQTDTCFSLPETAVTNMDDLDYVLTTKDMGADPVVFEKKAVQLGKSSGGYLEILNSKDFVPGTQFLSNGTFKLVTD
ncbi:MAG: efflux RND transporter periplasmic adaptor subunit [Bacteroidota bacterium]